MKKLLLIVISSLLITACNKTQNVKTTVTIFSSAPKDTITLVDNGITYVDTLSHNAGTFVEPSIVIQKEISYSRFSMDIYSNATFPIDMNIDVYPGPLNGIGVYKMSPVDSTFNDNSFAETFNGGEAYIVDSITVTITTADGDTVIGSYQAWVSNVAGNKIVSGIIKTYNAEVE